MMTALARTFCLDWQPEYQRCLAYEWLFPQDSAHVLAEQHIAHAPPPPRFSSMNLDRDAFERVANRSAACLSRSTRFQDWLKENLGSFRKKQGSHWFCGLRRRSIFW